MPIHLHLTRTALRGSALWALLASRDRKSVV